MASLCQCAGSENSIAWLRAKWLMQTTKAARAVLRSSRQLCGLEQLDRPVQGVAERDVGQGGGQHRHIGARIGEMVVQVPHALGPQALRQDRRLGEVEQLPQRAAQSWPAAAQRQTQRAEIPPWRAGQRPQMGPDQGERPLRRLQHVERPRLLGDLLGSDQLVRPDPADRAALDLVADLAQGRDLAQDEGMGRLRVFPRQIGDLQGRGHRQSVRVKKTGASGETVAGGTLQRPPLGVKGREARGRVLRPDRKRFAPPASIESEPLIADCASARETR